MKMCVKHKVKTRNYRALSILELLFASVISLILISGTLSVLIMAQKNAMIDIRYNKDNSEARLISDMVAKDVRGAAGLEASYGSYMASSNSLILKIPSIDSNENIIDVENTFDRIIYHPNETDPDTIERSVFPNVSSSRASETKTIGKALMGSAYDGTFLVKPDALGAYVIHFQFMIRRTFQGVDYEMPISGSVKLRNKT